MWAEHIYQGSHRVWKTGKTGKKIMVREFYFGPKVRKSQGILLQNADCHANLLLYLSIIEKVCHQYHEYESANVNFQEIYFLLFQVLQQQYWIKYRYHCDLSNMFTYDIDWQPVIDKMVREISLEVWKFLVGTLYMLWTWAKYLVKQLSNSN